MIVKIEHASFMNAGDAIEVEMFVRAGCVREASSQEWPKTKVTKMLVAIKTYMLTTYT